MSSGQGLLGASVTVTPPPGADWNEFEGEVRAVYVGDSRMRFVVKPNDHDRLHDVPSHACWLADPAQADAKDDPSGAMTAITVAAIDYAMQHPAQDEGNEYQATLIAAVADWLRREERSLWLTDLCAGGRCEDCQHDSCECPHHTGVEPK